MAIQVNVKLDEELVKGVDEMVKRGLVRTKKEAFEKALLMLIRSYKASELMERIDTVRKGTRGLPSATEAVAKSHEEEDE